LIRLIATSHIVTLPVRSPGSPPEDVSAVVEGNDCSVEETDVAGVLTAAADVEDAAVDCGVEVDWGEPSQNCVSRSSLEAEYRGDAAENSPGSFGCLMVPSEH
jgi:hypothetical protein